MYKMQNQTIKLIFTKIKLIHFTYQKKKKKDLFDLFLLSQSVNIVHWWTEIVLIVAVIQLNTARAKFPSLNSVIDRKSICKSTIFIIRPLDQISKIE